MKTTSCITALIGMALSSVIPVVVSQDRSATAMRAADFQGIEQVEIEIARVATEIANSRRFFEEDYGVIKVTARYDIAQGVLFLDPGTRFGPVSGYGEIEDLHSYIYHAVHDIAETLPNYTRTEWVYGGLDLYHWFPQDRRAIGDQRHPSRALVAANSAVKSMPGVPPLPAMPCRG